MASNYGQCHCGHHISEHYNCGAPWEMACYRCGCYQFTDRAFQTREVWQLKTSEKRADPKGWERRHAKYR